MTALLVPPSPMSVLRREHLARFEALVARQRAELSRLRLAVRSAQRRAERAEQVERAAAESARRERAEVPEHLVSAIDAMLEKSVGRAQRAIHAARRHGAATVAAARERAGTRLRAAGIDPEFALDPSTWSTATGPQLTAPRTGRELWRAIEADAAFGGMAATVVVPPPTTATASGPEPRPSRPERTPADAGERRPRRDLVAAAAIPWRAPDPVAHREVDGGPPDHLEVLFEDDDLELVLEGGPPRLPVREVVPAAVGPPPRRRTLPSPAGPPGRGPLPRPRDEAALFDVFWRGQGWEGVFWNEAESSRRPIRELLRRRMPEGQW